MSIILDNIEGRIRYFLKSGTAYEEVGFQPMEDLPRGRKLVFTEEGSRALNEKIIEFLNGWALIPRAERLPIKSE
jgi:hypothetical protein